MLIQKPHSCFLGLCCATLIVLFVVLPAQADDSNPISTALSKCSEIEDDTARLTCFDALAAMNPKAQAQSISAPISAPTAGPVPLTDDIGKEAVVSVLDDERAKYSAVVTRCEESPQSGQYYFFLENGQVWKQSNYQRLRYRDCAFEVTLSKDNFGYQLYIPSKDRSVRVVRIK